MTSVQAGEPAATDIDVMTVEVGSTITKINGFARRDGAFAHVAQGFAATSVDDGDVGIGVAAARADLAARWGRPVGDVETFVNSSAAGGLRMSVHGLTASMTTRAATEGSLGAGAIVVAVTVGALDADDLADVARLRPNMILLAGGVDFGEKEIVVANARRLASLRLPVPVVYAGNVAARRAVAREFSAAGIELIEVDNVFPDVDVLRVEPLRHAIHEVFNRHIVHAPGMAALAQLTNHEILPTPGAVLRGAELFAEAVGDVLVVDVGGATTDVHSVTDGSEEFAALATDPTPRSRRTVEGDLGVFRNAANIVATQAADERWRQPLAGLRAIPDSPDQAEFVRWLCAQAVTVGVRRHAGTVTEIFTPTGKKRVVRGKDLTAIRYVVATGGALTRVPGAAQSIRAVCTGAGTSLLPPPQAQLLVDRDYLFSALGTMAHAYPDEVRETLRRWADRETGPGTSTDPGEPA